MSIIDKVIDIAKDEIGVREEGDNDGTRVHQYQKADTLPGVGYAWCGSFTSWCLKQADRDLKYCYSASCDVIAAWARSNDILHETPRRGDIFLLFAAGSTTDAIHTGLVTDVDGAAFRTVEGNTNLTGSPRGIGVFALNRTNGNRYRFVRWIDLNRDAGEPADYRVFIGDRELRGKVIGAAAFVRVRDWADALGFTGRDLGWNDDKQVPLFQGREVPVQIRKFGGDAWASVRKLAEFSGLYLDMDGERRTIRVKRSPLNF